MSSSDESGGGGSCSSSSGTSSSSQGRLKGVRRRKWGKWVSEIRVPGTQERLWLGTYSSPEAAAVAHDIAKYCLRENAVSVKDFNFPLVLPAGVYKGMSPRSVQKAATDAGMAVDAQFLSNRSSSSLDSAGTEQNTARIWRQGNNNNISDDDICSSVLPSWNTNEFDGGSSHGDALNISVYDYL